MIYALNLFNLTPGKKNLPYSKEYFNRKEPK